MPQRFQEQYDEIERTGGEPTPSRLEAARQAAQEWGVHIISVVVLILVGVLVFIVTPAFVRMTETMEDVTQGQKEAAVRGCIVIATSDAGVLPSTCLTEEPLTRYAGDVIDALDTTGPQARNRLVLCNALDRLGRSDNDC